MIRIPLYVASWLSLLSVLTLAQEPAPQQSARSPMPRVAEQPELPASVAYHLALPPVVSLGDADIPPVRAENQIGIHRMIPELAWRSGVWTTIPGGARVWRLSIRSAGARSLRLRLSSFAAGMGKLYVFAPSDNVGDSVQGPYVGNGPVGDHTFWTGIVEGDTIAIEFQPGSIGDITDMLPFQLGPLSHSFVSAVASIPLEPPKKIVNGERNAAASCTLDVSCFSTYSEASDAVAKIQYETGEGSFVCTGWLINTRSSSFVPYFITNNHCIGNQSIANTMATFWKYHTASCNGPRPSQPPRQTIGATLLAPAPFSVLDFAFLRLPSAPPGAVFLGWNTAKSAINTSITSVGHPAGDYQRIAFGVITGGATTDKFSHRPGNATSGLTQGGSSGSPWMSSPGVVVGLHARGNAANFANPCRALADGEISGGGEWFSAIYPYISSFLEDTPACTISVSPQSASFPSAGGTGSIQVTASSSSCSRNASTTSSFITITSGATGSGNGTVNYMVAINPTTSSRTGSISIGNRTITITQAPTASCVAAPIQPGTTVTGSLSSAACNSQRRPGRYARQYTFNGNAGQEVSITMSSSQFDTYLYLIGPSGAVVASDDDGGTGTDSRIPLDTGTIPLPSAGTYVVEATSFAVGVTGTFSLIVRETAGCSLQPISSGQNITGSLSSADCLSPLGGNFFADRFTFFGTAGQAVSITMTSPTMDTWLTLLSPSGEVVAEDDDSAGNLNSRIPPSGFLTLTQTGTYIIEASTYDSFETGLYTVSFSSSGAPPPAGSRLRAVTPCRVFDSRNPAGTFGGPLLTGGSTRTIPIQQGSCGISSTAKAYTLNITVVPSGPLSYLTTWPSGGAQPTVSTLNSFAGRVVANAAIVPAGTNGGINIFVTDTTHVIVDINGYFE
ncbi:MAG: pre-peptidase C-terminal domain-containing protein [Acidobacteria bacterium]|nr:pre-peptidase C-terminal domain-containing protein [Acidobacteriota bacterium]